MKYIRASDSEFVSGRLARGSTVSLQNEPEDAIEVYSNYWFLESRL